MEELILGGRPQHSLQTQALDPRRFRRRIHRPLASLDRKGFVSRVCTLVCGLALQLVSSGCSWLNRPGITGSYALPQVLPASPTLDQVLSAVNSNGTQIRNFVTDQAVISGPGFPNLRAMIAFERPLRLRIRAGTRVTGMELDLGSNDELFWVWVRREPQMFLCRHDRFHSSPIRQAFPLEPKWISEALGVLELPLHLAHQGPKSLGDGRLQITTLVDTPEGPSSRITVVDARSAVVREQYIFDRHGQLVVSAVAQQHRRDPLSGLIMPRVVELRAPQMGLAFRVDLANVRINRPIENGESLWAMPRYEGWTLVDLAEASWSPPPEQQGALRKTRHAVRETFLAPLKPIFAR